MIIEKLPMDLGQVAKEIKEEILQVIDQQNNPTTQFFKEFQEIQKKLKDQDNTIKHQQSIINDLMQQQGLEDKYTMQRKQLFRSENRCVALQTKLTKQENQINQLQTKLQNISDQNEALKMMNESINKYLHEYETIIKEHEKKELLVQPNKKQNCQDNLCSQCQNHNSEIRGNYSLDLSSSQFMDNTMQSNIGSVMLPQKSQSSDDKSHLQINQKTFNHSKSVYQADQKRPLERSSTSYYKQPSAFDNEIRMHRSKAVKNENKSDKIVNDLNLKHHKKVLKFQDCSIYQIEQSHDQSNFAIVNAKSELKIVNSILLKETQSVSTINQNITETIKFSNMKNLLLQGGQDKCITVYQCDPYQTYHFKAKLRGHNQSVRALKFQKNDNDTKIISGSLDQTIRLWDLHTEQQIYFIRTGSKVNTLDCFNSSDEIVTGHNDGSIKMYRDKNLINSMYLDQPCVTNVQMSNDDRYAIATNSEGQEISYIDIRMWKIIHKLQNINYTNTSNYNKPTFAFDDRYVVAGSNDGEIYIWSLDDIKCPPSVLIADKNCTIHCTLYNRDSNTIHSTDSQGNLNIWKK